MSAVAKILDRLDRPRQTRPGAWAAGCPCCQSRHGRPISIRESEDGRVLLHAFCGCETGHVLGALGLTLGDLFERPIGSQIAPTPSRVPARDLLIVISEEVTVAALIAGNFLERRSIDEAAWKRLAQAASRIGAARDHAR